MRLSEKGDMILSFVNLMLEKNDSATNASLTEEQLRKEIDFFCSRFEPNMTEEERRLILRKVIFAKGIYKPKDEAIHDDFEYHQQSPDWFTNIKSTHKGWFDNYYDKLRGKNWSPNVIKELDRSSDAIMNFLGDPSCAEFNIRGLIMGDIQSGKTANFIALCNKAADAGYRVIIVTAGIIEKLRSQTQGRIENEFVNLIKSKPVPHLTGKSYDFKQTQANNPLEVFRNDVPVLCVVKKNVTVLQYLYDWLHKGVPEDSPISFPLLFIDDEADNASINTNKLSNDANLTRTNELIRKILKSFKKSSYVAITATPFANVFIDPDSENDVVADDLFPRNFVYRLTTPSNYFGAEKLFAPGSSYVNLIDDIELWLPTSHKSTDYPQRILPLSLRTAIGYFLLVNGVMDVMRDHGDAIRHRTMMIHISRFISIQNRLTEIVEEYVNRLRARIGNFCCSPEKAEFVEELSFLHKIWNDYSLADKCYSMEWEDFLANYLYKAVEMVETLVVNSKSISASLDYENSEKRVIVVGGNALSRGLTLEGLVVSYFRRNTLMSDSLLQMSRWCGYKDYYQSLVKVWMPESAQDDFGYACEISDDLSEMFHQIVEQKGSPKDFAFRIRKSPGAMLPTARNKMRSARMVSFPVVLSGHAIETPKMINDAAIITDNNNAVMDFLRENASHLENVADLLTTMRFFRGVKVESICRMLSRYKTGMMSYGFTIPQIRDYISHMQTDWDVAVAYSCGKDGFFDHRLLFPIKKSKRKLAVNQSHILISGTKRKVSSGGVMHYMFTEAEQKPLVVKYQSQPGKESSTPPDSFYLQEAELYGKKPLLVIQYVSMSSLTADSVTEPERNEFFAFSFGFPGRQRSQQAEMFYFSKSAYQSVQEYAESEEEE